MLGGNDRPTGDGQLRNLRVVNTFIIVLTYLLTFLLAYLNLINILIIYGPYVIIRMLHWEPGVTCLVGSIFRNKKWFSCSICSNFGICECGCRGACSSRASSSGMGVGVGGGTVQIALSSCLLYPTTAEWREGGGLPGTPTQTLSFPCYIYSTLLLFALLHFGAPHWVEPWGWNGGAIRCTISSNR